ncbi:MAG: hypothetical protein R3B07_34665 [Polyangiaceae bacterium]
MKLTNLSVLGVLVCVACGGGSNGPGAISPKDDSGQRTKGGQAVTKAAAAGFQRALDQFVSNDQKGSWSESSCGSVAGEFLNSAKGNFRKRFRQAFPRGTGLAGLAYARCGQDDKAKAQFQAAAGASEDFHRARAQLALYEYQSSKSLDATIELRADHS